MMRGYVHHFLGKLYIISRKLMTLLTTEVPKSKCNVSEWVRYNRFRCLLSCGFIERLFKCFLKTAPIIMGRTLQNVS